MLDLGRVEEVRALLADGLSQRGTSRATGVSRGTVAAIQHDRWAPVFSARAAARAGATESIQFAAVIARAREAAARKGPESLRQLFARHGPPELDLRPSEKAEYKAEYIEVRRKLRASGELPPDAALKRE